MKKVFFLGMLGAISINSIAQNIGLGTQNPHKSAILDISSTTKGVLIPRMAALLEMNIVTPEKGLLIYQTNQQRFRYNAGTALSRNFVNIYNNDDQQNGYGQWWLTANENTSPGNRFVGTTTAADLVIKVNNQQVAKFGHSTGNVAIGLEAGRFALGSNNIFIGRRVSWVNSAGFPTFASNQIAIGDSALHNFIGTPALIEPQPGSSITLPNGFNIAIGANAMQRQSLSGSNIAIGSNALMGAKTQYTINKPWYNVAIGYNALTNVNAGYKNVGIGKDVGRDVINTYRFTAVGQLANAGGVAAVVDGNTSGFPVHDITLFGSNATTSFNQANITVIGNQAKAIGTLNNRVENQMVFGNEEVTKWAFGRTTTDANRALQVGTNNTNGNGAYLTRTGNWTNVSDQNKKQDFTQIDDADLLNKLAQLPITRWQYKAGPGWHIGPMAQDFKAIFNLGNNDDKTINTVDPAGIALAAIKALLAETNELKTRVLKLESANQ